MLKTIFKDIKLYSRKFFKIQTQQSDMYYYYAILLQIMNGLNKALAKIFNPQKMSILRSVLLSNGVARTLNKLRTSKGDY